jgi:hypothetical protein
MRESVSNCTSLCKYSYTQWKKERNNGVEIGRKGVRRESMVKLQVRRVNTE